MKMTFIFIGGVISAVLSIIWFIFGMLASYSLFWRDNTETASRHRSNSYNSYTVYKKGDN